jgi:hypothetical protein
VYREDKMRVKKRPFRPRKNPCKDPVKALLTPELQKCKSEKSPPALPFLLPKARIFLPFFQIPQPPTRVFAATHCLSTKCTHPENQSLTAGPGSSRADQVLFVDARHIHRQVDRAHRDWTPWQISFLANVVRLYRGQALDFTLGADEARAKIEETSGCGGGVSPSQKSGKKSATVIDCRHKDVPGLCHAATLKEIEAQGWSLNPGRYAGVAAGESVSDEEFKQQLETCPAADSRFSQRHEDSPHSTATNR